MTANTNATDLFSDGSERSESQAPAIDLLARMGYKYLPRNEALAVRGSKTTRVLLEDIAHTQLAALNRIHYKGREHHFTDANIRRAIQALEDVTLAEGTQRASEQVYDLLRLGKSLEQTIEGDTKSFTLHYVDWEHWENNVFHATSEYLLQRAGSQQTCRLDIVLFVNGIPFVVIECEAPATDIDKGIGDIMAYQRAEYVPELFKYAQIVLACNRKEAKYGTTGTEPRFWAVWKNRGGNDAEIEDLLNTPLNKDEREAIRANFLRETPLLYAAEQQGRLVTEQDRALFYLCRPERLLELAGQFILYDGGQKKIARYQQYDAVKKAMRKITSRKNLYTSKRGSLPTPNDERGGVIWHTQGSGKSLTMVMLGSAIALAPEIPDPRIILVTDRVDLDKQIANTFHRCGLTPQRATSGANLRELIQGRNGKRAGVITTLVQKFSAVLTSGELVDTSPDVFLLVDESHRTQYGALHAQMRRVFPNACYIGFTGTPLLHKDKSTVAKFGDMIDTYTMEEAVADKAVVPLLYERRHVVQDVDAANIDRRFERQSEGLSDEQRKDLKKKYSRAEMLTKTEQRLYETAFDISNHYRKNWQTEDKRYKAQIVAPDKKSAIQLHNYLKEIGQVESEVVISPPDEREGTEEPEESAAEIVRNFWKKKMDEYGSEERYNEQAIARFNSPAAPEILIVVDKLLTGFDVPRNTVLYLTRRLAHHTLLQAIARVNRLYEEKEFGYILDYVGVLGELDRALTEYAALAGYDLKDIEGTIHNIRETLEQLPQKHAALLDLFKTLPNKSDGEAYEQFLAPEDTRHEFYALYTDYAKCLRMALSTELFYAETAPTTIDRYKADLTRFQKLRASVQQRYYDVVDMKKLEPQILKMLDTYVRSDSVEILTPEPVNIFDTAAMEKALATLGTPAAQADMMAHATERTLIERMDEDPALFRKFSELLRETIQAFHDHLMSEMEYLKRARELRDQVATRSTSSVPETLADHPVAQAYYHILQDKWEQIAVTASDQNAPVEIALRLDKAIQELAVVDWRQKADVLNRIRADIDDTFFDFSEQGKIRLDWSAIDEIAAEVLRVAKSRLQ